jgi:protein-S-isoprenylcysteine O-methyltransferase Ste14
VLPRKKISGANLDIDKIARARYLDIVNIALQPGGVSMTENAAINLHKALVVPFVLALMVAYGNSSVEAWAYLAMHGSYAVLWLVKQATFPDQRFTRRQPLAIAIFFVFLPLGSYLAAPYLLVSRGPVAPPWLLGAAIVGFTLGVFLHFTADAQKYYSLRQAKQLITDGLFARTRNPNYLGEILIYLAFASLSQHWLPFVVLAAWVGGFFLRNMRAKDRSLSRYPGFAEYRARSWMLLPRPFPASAGRGQARPDGSPVT